MKKVSSLAIIGYGAVADEIIHSLEQRSACDRLVGILVRRERISELHRKAAGRFRLFDSIDQLAELRPDIVIEAAGHSAVRQYGEPILNAGIDFLVSSVGALADDATSAKMKGLESERASIWIASGAVAGIDGLLAARTLAPRSVSYTSVKPPKAWLGTPGEHLGAADTKERLTFFTGTAREAASQYPQNANVAATTAFAGIGLDRTRVELVSDPDIAGPLGIIQADGAFGEFRFHILALPSRSNPKSSALTGHSLVSAALDGMRFSPYLI